MPTPEFVLRLRERIGHDPLWLTGVTGVVLRDGQVLMTRLPSGTWTLVSGILEPGEQPARAVVRELMEETGVVGEVEQLVCVTSDDAPRAYPNGDLVQYLDLTFRCRYVSGQARVLDDENVDVRWFPLDGLPPVHERTTHRISCALADRPDGQPHLER